MKRSFIAALCLILLAFSSAYAEEPKTSSFDLWHFLVSARGGFFFPQDKDFRKVYGNWTNDIYYFELGWMPYKNIEVMGAVGGYYQNAHTIGSVTGETSGQDVFLVMAPIEIGLGYWLRFKENQIIVPRLGVGCDFVYFHEKVDKGKLTQGLKVGPVGWGGVLLLLDRLEPKAALVMKRDYGIQNTYLELGAKYALIGDKNKGLNLSGPTVTLGLILEF